MRAALYDPTASPPSIRFIDVDDRALGPNEARIDVRAVAMDALWLAGDPNPAIPGRVFAGEVVEVGAAVTRVAVGDRVTAISRDGGLSERAVAAEHGLHLLPSASTFVDGVAAFEGIVATFVISDLVDALPVAADAAIVAVHHAGDCFGSVIAGLLRFEGIASIGVAAHPMEAEHHVRLGYRSGADLGEGSFAAGVLRHADGRGVHGLIDHVGSLTLDDASAVIHPGGCFLRCSPHHSALPPSSQDARTRLAADGVVVLEFDLSARLARRADEIETLGSGILRALRHGDIVIPTVEVPFAEVTELPALLRTRAVVGRVVVTR